MPTIYKNDNIRSNISHNTARNESQGKVEATAKECQGKGKKKVADNLYFCPKRLV